MQVHPLGVGIGRQVGRSPASCRRPFPSPGRSRRPRWGPPQLAHQIGKQDRRRLVRPLQIIEYQQQPGRSRRLGQPWRTSANSANRWALPESAPPARAGRSASPNDSRPQVGAGRVVVSGPDGGLVQHQPPQAVRRRTVPVGRPRPRHRHAPAAASAAASSASRVFPTPASPVHSTSRPRPARASSRSDVTRASSRSRPTIIWAAITLHRATINGREPSCIGSSRRRTCAHGRRLAAAGGAELPRMFGTYTLAVLGEMS